MRLVGMLSIGLGPRLVFPSEIQATMREAKCGRLYVGSKGAHVETFNGAAGLRVLICSLAFTARSGLVPSYQVRGIPIGCMRLTACDSVVMTNHGYHPPMPSGRRRKRSASAKEE